MQFAVLVVKVPYVIMSVPAQVDRQTESLYVRRKLCLLQSPWKNVGDSQVSTKRTCYCQVKENSQHLTAYTPDNRKYIFIHLESGQEKQSGDVHSQEAKRDGGVSSAQSYSWVI